MKRNRVARSKTAKPTMTGGPYVALAVLCERVLQDSDGVMTVIRIIDTVNLAIPEKAGPLVMPVTALIGFRSGAAKGKMTLTLRGHTPNPKTTMPEMSIPVKFDGKGNSGINLPLNMNLTLTTSGLYLFDVLLNDQLMTQLPLRVNFDSQREGTSQAATTK